MNTGCSRSDESPRVVSLLPLVIVIVQPQEDSLRELLRNLQHNPQLNVVGVYTSIADAFRGGLSEPARVDFVIVLQSFSDEYSVGDANLLIGRMLFGRVFCCYGPWCTGDGRSHEIWPVSVRVPAGSAITVMQHELEAFAAGRSPLLPMAAAEEIFDYRVQAQADSASAVRSHGAVVISSSEAVLRELLARQCRELGFQCKTFSETGAAVRQALKEFSYDFREPGALLVIIDLDPLDDAERQLISLLRTEFPSCRVLGTSVFAETSWTVPGCEKVLEKTELFFRLPAELGCRSL